jgi:hypothetical protein
MSRRGFQGDPLRVVAGCNRVTDARNGAAVTNRVRRGGGEYVGSWSRVWEWPTAPDVYVDPEVLRAYFQEAKRGR